MANRKRFRAPKQSAPKRRIARSSVQEAKSQTRQPAAEAIIQPSRQVPRSLSPGNILQLQRMYGNRAVSQMITTKRNGNGTSPIQTQLTVGPVSDGYEKEADHMADRVMAMSQETVEQGSTNGQSSLTRKETGLQMAQDDRKLQAKGMTLAQRQEEGGFTAGSDVESRLESQRGGGKPLPLETRAFMEPRFGVDFKDVRTHNDSEADSLNDTLQAKAFTSRNDIFFKDGAYQPGRVDGQRLIAHELTHVVQQGGAVNSPKIQRAGTKPRSFSKNYEYMVKLSSAREKFVYENKEQLGMSHILPGYYPVISKVIEDDEVTQVKVDKDGEETIVELKNPIQKPKPGQELLCIQTLGFEPESMGEQKAEGSDKFVMDIKIGTHTKSMKQFELEGASWFKRAFKNIEHGLKDRSWLKIPKLFHGSRDRGYDICDGGPEFATEHKKSSSGFKEALNKVMGDMLVVHKALTKKDISFVGASIFAVFNMKNPENSVAKVIDPDHPILMDDIDQEIQKDAPENVMTGEGFGLDKLRQDFRKKSRQVDRGSRAMLDIRRKYLKAKEKLAKKWVSYQKKWKKSFRGGLTKLLQWFRTMLKKLRRQRRRILNRPLPKPPQNR